VSDKRLRELKDLSPVELQQKLKELREEVFNLRFRNSMRQLDNALQIRGTRRDIARVMTLLRESESAKGGKA
jgi:large subunit ribosomal protein L29